MLLLINYASGNCRFYTFNIPDKIIQFPLPLHPEDTEIIRGC